MCSSFGWKMLLWLDASSRNKKLLTQHPLSSCHFYCKTFFWNHISKLFSINSSSRTKWNDKKILTIVSIPNLATCIDIRTKHSAKKRICFQQHMMCQPSSANHSTRSSSLNEKINAPKIALHRNIITMECCYKASAIERYPF